MHPVISDSVPQSEKSAMETWWIVGVVVLCFLLAMCCIVNAILCTCLFQRSMQTVLSRPNAALAGKLKEPEEYKGRPPLHGGGGARRDNGLWI